MENIFVLVSTVWTGDDNYFTTYENMQRDMDMTWWIDKHAEGLPIWTGWCKNGRLLRGNDLWSWTRIFSASTSPYVWYIAKWFQEAFVFRVQEIFVVIDEIWELNYVKFTICVFKCKWVDSNTGDLKFFWTIICCLGISLNGILI